MANNIIIVQALGKLCRRQRNPVQFNIHQELDDLKKTAENILRSTEDVKNGVVERE